MSPHSAVPVASGAYTPADLAKLTVPQLKALCKEQKIPGYSKLGKQALVQKLVDNGLCSGFGGALGPGAPSVTSAATVPPDIATHTPTAAPSCGSIPGATALDASFSSIHLPDTTGSTTDGMDASRPPVVAPSKPKPQKKTRKPKVSQPSALSETRPDSATVSRQSSKVVTSLASATTPHTAQTATPSSSIVTSGQIQPPSPGLPRQASSLARNAPSSRASATANKRARPSLETMPPPPLKKQRVLSFSSTPNIQRSPVPATAAISKPPAPVTTTKRVPAPPVVPVAVTVPPAPAKRFKPLVVHKAKVPVSASSAPMTAAASPSVPVSVLAIAEEALSSIQDFEASVPALRPITLPPSLAQRKRVHRWAVILSGLSNEERAVCALVSRAFRYAVYLSASCILTGQYHGRRLQDDVLRKHSQAMTNMWPYLRARELEVDQRRRAYETSFLARLFQRCGLANPVSRYLWTSPNSSRQLLVAIRFALTRAWFELSVGTSPGGAADPNSWLQGTVVDAQEVVAGEIWLIAVEYAASVAPLRPREAFYVLEATCEVVGRPSAARSGAEDASVSVPVRADWSAYIERRRAAPQGDSTPPLLGHLKWACVEDYDQGVSKLWLKKVAGDGAAGDSKRMVAERYVLACVIGNGISGQWMTANEMAQEFAGLPERVAAPPGRQKSSALNLYLPEHHHVESVHFTAAGGKALHVGLAVVQTPHREYFILRDNGMQVGCEEEGVARVWQEVLGCDAKGVSTPRHGPTIGREE
ncbi:hypothetical protein K466DRAFT_645800 [Polyporus arcularius HHB13444]|uniref:Rho termination factor N-terminal domain-containing protein n=1 Tax=Polyporus arcularius HHB13444 TaxID=1314778 RepID=A0A5C3PG99_9APHY|nr:hypothetical protein K466DRAFT_645800 [Polyporus arcularius HHB13444]